MNRAAILIFLKCEVIKAKIHQHQCHSQMFAVEQICFNE